MPKRDVQAGDPGQSTTPKLQPVAPEAVRVVYVISRVIEFVDVHGEDNLSARMTQLLNLIRRDRQLNLRVQARENQGAEKASAQPEEPAGYSWTECRVKRTAWPSALRLSHSSTIPLANSFAMLDKDQDLAESWLSNDDDDLDLEESCEQTPAVEKRRPRRKRRPAARSQLAPRHRLTDLEQKWGSAEYMKELPAAADNVNFAMFVDALPVHSGMDKPEGSARAADEVGTDFEELAKNYGQDRQFEQHLKQALAKRDEAVEAVMSLEGQLLDARKRALILSTETRILMATGTDGGDTDAEVASTQAILTLQEQLESARRALDARVAEVDEVNALVRAGEQP